MAALFILFYFITGCVAALAVDWLVCTRLAAFRTNFAYDYRPGLVRSVVLASIVAFLVYLFWTNDPAHPWLPGLVITLVLFILYGQIAATDVGRRLVPIEDD